MPPRSKVLQLPPAVKEWLDKALVDGNFSNYEQLEKLLADRGYVIGKSSLNRYGQDFEQRLHALKLATQQAKVISESAPDDAGAMSDALIRLVQQKAFDSLLKMDELTTKDIGLLVSRLSNATVRQRQWAAEVREKASAAAAAVEKIAKKGGLSASAVNEIRSQILGIPS
jgi:hypothetical protein